MENEVYCTVISKQLRWVLGFFFCLLVVLLSFQRPLHFVLLFFKTSLSLVFFRKVSAMMKVQDFKTTKVLTSDDQKQPRKFGKAHCSS